ncbi:hypothetical protein L1887_38314 [Cichorium endivia]|nr:hypothetical protein L1887_38314 [Cichorium endivia]
MPDYVRRLTLYTLFYTFKTYVVLLCNKNINFNGLITYLLRKKVGKKTEPRKPEEAIEKSHGRTIVLHHQLSMI